jgi:aryl-alcohol dehydrogenase-like predicted oxidoreductase
MYKELVFWTRQIWWMPSYKNFNEKKAIELLQYAFSQWIKYYDTAPIYWNGQSEILLWKALKYQRENIKIITKFWIVNDNFIYTKESINKELEASLKRLQTNYIDTYLLHIPEGKIPVDVIIETLEELKKIWKIKSYWVANCQWELLKEFIKKWNIEYVQDFYNLMFLEPEKNIFPYLQEGQKFMSYSPLYRWLLTEQSIQELLHREEWAINRLLKNNELKSKLKRLNILKIIATKQDISITELAYKFVFSKPENNAVLVGTTSKRHLDIAINYWKKYR